jgi:TetR/AcrR family transcriptional repressor of bet genes
MGPIRREQICRAAAKVIAREGFAGSTMRMVAEEAGVSTGMLNHYFANRLDVMAHALSYVSERANERIEAAIDGAPPGRERVDALLEAIVADDEDSLETWKIWIYAYGEAVRSRRLRETLEALRDRWYALIDRALGGVLSAEPDGLAWSRRLDAILSGLTIRALTSDAIVDRELIRRESMRVLGLQAFAGEQPGPPPVRASRHARPKRARGARTAT